MADNKTREIKIKIEDRTLYLSKQVDQTSIHEVTQAIHNINYHDEKVEAELASLPSMNYERPPITFYIDSYGGQVYSALGLVDQMKLSKTPIHTVVTGCAMSAGQLIAMSGHKRYCTKNSTFMVHQLASWVGGKLDAITDSVTELDRLNKILMDLTLDMTSIDQERLLSVYEKKQDWYIDSTQAKRLNIVDEIIK